MLKWIQIFLLLVLVLQSFGPPLKTEAVALPGQATQTAEPEPEQDSNFRVVLHPEGIFQVGDPISVDIYSTPVEGRQQPLASGRKLRAKVIYPINQDLGEAGFANEANGRQRAFLRWAWDTSDLKPGLYYLYIEVLPDGVSWFQPIELEPASQSQAEWETVKTECCEIGYISGTRAEREIDTLKDVIQAQAEDVERRLGFDMEDPIHIWLIPRILGHGGFATEEIYVSYPDENYIGIDETIVIHHEIVHKVDGEMGGDFRPTILVEGLAVYASDGHYKIEDIPARAHALIDLDRYIPLQELADNFYPAQHETGYIEGGALVHYLIDAYGWERFNTFYRSMKAPRGETQSEVIGRALQENFQITFEEMETGFKEYLSLQPVSDPIRADVELSVRFYDLVRDYQRELDPSAYFRQAWLPSGKEMRERGIVVDYLKSPQSPANAVLEALLASAGQDLQAGAYDQGNATLDTVEELLNRTPVETGAGSANP